MGITHSFTSLLTFAFLSFSLVTISVAQNLLAELKANGINLVAPGDAGFGPASAACEPFRVTVPNFHDIYARRY